MQVEAGGVERKRTAPTLSSGPSIRAQRKLVGKTIMLEEDMWPSLDEIAEFHSAAFTETDPGWTGISRNRVIISLLAWAIDAYWADKGGSPVSDSDRLAKIKEYSERLLSQQSKRPAAANDE